MRRHCTDTFLQQHHQARADRRAPGVRRISTTATVQPELEHWIIEQARTGTPPEAVLQRLLEQGWSEQAAMEAVEQVLQKHLRDQSGHNGIPMPVRVPSPIDLNGRAVLDDGTVLNVKDLPGFAEKVINKW